MEDKINPALLEDSTDPPEVDPGDAPEVQALKAVMREDGIAVRRILREMPRRDRAVLDFWITELSGAIFNAQQTDGI